MDACFNVYCTNATYKHIHHSEYTIMYIILMVSKHFCQQNQILKNELFSQHANLSRCHDTNVIRDSTI
jgi:hypothetical protein